MAESSTNITRFVSGGPYGGDIRKIVIDPSNSQIVYATTAGGFFRSTDGGHLWQPINKGLNIVSTARDLAVDPNNSNHIFIAMWDFGHPESQHNRGIYESWDCGESWQQKNISLGASDVTIDPQNSNILYAGTEQGVFKSIDGGNTWIPKTQNIIYYVSYIVTCPQNMYQCLC